MGRFKMPHLVAGRYQSAPAFGYSRNPWRLTIIDSDSGFRRRAAVFGGVEFPRKDTDDRPIGSDRIATVGEIDCNSPKESGMFISTNGIPRRCGVIDEAGRKIRTDR